MTMLAALHKPKPAFIDAVINGVMFNISWLAIILTQSALVAVTVVALHLLVHFTVMGKGLREARLVAAVTLFGAILDQVLFRAEVFKIDGVVTLAPFWLTCLWPVLATTLLHAFAKLQQRLFLAIAFGAIGGGASYAAGTRMSDVAFGSGLFGPLIMGLLWAFIFPLLLRYGAAIERGGAANEGR